MATDRANSRLRRAGVHRRAMLWSLLGMAVAAMVLPLGGYVYVGFSEAQAQSTWQEQNPRSDMWGAVRRDNAGYTAVAGQEAGVLIQTEGQLWREIRNGPVASIMPWVMLAAIVAVLLVYLIAGQNKLKERPSGRMVPRWALWERTLHWTTATLFILMAITGLSMLFGRAVLIPLLGIEGFAAYAMFAKSLHNYVGVFFTACVLVMILAWIWWNIPNKTDLQWFKRGGGYIKDKHPPAGRANGGEKLWFWFIAIVGGAVCVTGLILDFPGFGQTRQTMQIANVIHAVASIAWISLFFGHAYIGTLGTEGAIEGMTTGEVSAEWAKQHHDQWYEKVKDRERVSGGETAKPKPTSEAP